MLYCEYYGVANISDFADVTNLVKVAKFVDGVDFVDVVNVAELDAETINSSERKRRGFFTFSLRGVRTGAAETEFP